MSKELEKLEQAFRKSDVILGESVDALPKSNAIHAAMQAFDQEKNVLRGQEKEAGQRLNQQGGERKPLSNWRRMMNSINLKWTYGLAGSASVAVLAMLIVGPNVGELLQDAPSRIQIPAEIQTEGAEELLVTEARNEDRAVDKSRSTVPKSSLLSERQAEPLVETLADQASNKSLVRRRGNEVSGFAATQIARIAPAQPTLDAPAQHYLDQGSDAFEAIETNPVKLVSEEPVSTFSIDVDTASYAFMRASLNNNVLPQKDAVRVEELINYFDYDYETPTNRSEPFRANVSIMPTPWNEGTKLLSIGIKGYELVQAETPAVNLVFLIDTSGSMNAPNKLPLLRNSFKLLLSNLKADDTVSIVTYAGSAGVVLEPTKAAVKNKILTALDNLSAGGSTAGAEGIRQAYSLAESSFRKDGVNRVILATDGDFNVGISNPEELKSYIERKRETGVTLSVLGFGRGNYNDALMQKLAQNGDGNASYIDTLSEARKVLVEEAGSTLFTIAKDVKLQVEFNPTLVSEYRLIGYETRALKREDFNNDKVDAGDIGAGHSVTAMYEITPVGSDARLVDDLRYSQNIAPRTASDEEYGFLKIRYKLPESDVSTLIERPLTVNDEVETIPDASADARFAASVAGFGQLLRGGQYTGSYNHDDVIALARSSKGDDEFGYRAEFINLVRMAKSAAALQPLKK